MSFEPRCSGRGSDDPDVSEIVRRYDEIGGEQLGDAFFSELTARLAQIRDRPTRFHRWKGDIRRANLVRFVTTYYFESPEIG